MPSALFSRLPKAPPRKFVPTDLDCSEIDKLKDLYEELLSRPLPDLGSVLKWFDDVQELAGVLGEHDSRTYIQKSVDTRDTKARDDYLHVIQKVHPALAPYEDKINRRLLSHPLRNKFPKRWALMLKAKQNAVDLFREKNIPLEKKIEETSMKYSQLMGGMEVKFQGKKRTMSQMAPFQEKTDRDLREKAWRTTAERRLKDASRIESIYHQLVKLRTRVAKNAGYSNFRDYCHQKYERFDYLPEDCFRFHEAVEEVVLPAVRELRKRRAKAMGLDPLRPWDLSVDVAGREPLKPFKSGQDLARLTQRVIRKIDPSLGAQFQMLIKHQLLDLDNRPGKEPGGYQCTLEETRVPFIFMNAVGLDRDVRVLLHEGGHAFHMLASRDEPISDYRHAPMEFCEVASMGMELLALPAMGKIYPRESDRIRSAQTLLEGTLDVLPWIATIDAFQHWVYTHPEHTAVERRRAWMKLRLRFSDGVSWAGLKNFEETLWHRQLHLFEYPFYYIEYGFAQIGALTVWHRSLKNRGDALRAYKEALSLGGSVGLRQLFKAVGGSLDFRPSKIRPLVNAVMDRLD
jgi:oligoendopeptidase F